jgi:hypothetical protein
MPLKKGDPPGSKTLFPEGDILVLTGHPAGSAESKKLVISEASGYESATASR